MHLWLVAGSHHGLWLNLLVLAMVGVCLPCAVHIWRDGTPGSLRQVMACGLAMAVLHAALEITTALLAATLLARLRRT